jgi:hypothetical protein
MAPTKGRLALEAEAFTRYLTGKSVNQLACDLYIRLHGQDKQADSRDDDKLVDVCIRYPFLIGLVDNGAAVFKKGASVRRKLHYMSCVLETMPEHSHLYLPQSHTFPNILWVGFMSGLAVLKAIAGYLLLTVLRKANGSNP